MDTPQATDQILRRPGVRELTGLPNTTIDRLLKAGVFPKPFRITPDPKCRAIGWSRNEIEAWIHARIADRDVAEVAQ